MSTHNSSRKAWRSVSVLAGACLAVAACSSLLDVKNPNDVNESALDNPAAAAALTNGVLAATVRMLSGTTVPYSVATDELDWIGSRDAWFDLETGSISNFLNEFTDGAFPFVGEARFTADNAIAKLEAFDAAGTLTNRTSLASAYLYGALVYTSIADMYDDYAFSTKQTPAAPIGRAQMGTLYDKAITNLDKALVIANTAAGNATLRYNILAYRARAKHAKAVWQKLTPKGATAPAAPLVNDAGANADANAAIALGSPDQKFTLVNNIEATAGINIWFEVNGRNEHRTGTTYRTLLDPVTGALDPTVQASLTAFSTNGGPAPAPAGAPSQAGTFTMTSSRELHLILAEAALAAGNTAGFRTELNIVRAFDAKPNYVGAPIGDQAMLAYERQAQLWLMRRRLSDMYRFGIRDPKWTANPNFESSFNVIGLMFPIPNVERLGNPCINEPTLCP